MSFRAQRGTYILFISVITASNNFGNYNDRSFILTSSLEYVCRVPMTAGLARETGKIEINRTSIFSAHGLNRGLNDLI